MFFSNNQILKKKENPEWMIHSFHKNIKQHNSSTLINIDNKCLLSIKSAY